MAPADVYRRAGWKPEYVFEIDGARLVPTGLNIIDGRRIDEAQLDQAVLVAGLEEFSINVNTPQELEAARERFAEPRGSNTSEMLLPRRVPGAYRLARISVFSALSVVGSFIHPPSPVQTVAFNSSPRFFAALYFGATDGALVSGIGHFAPSIVNGFSLGVLHLPIASGMAVGGQRRV
jgi:hypothetical protein